MNGQDHIFGTENSMSMAGKRSKRSKLRLSMPEITRMQNQSKFSFEENSLNQQQGGGKTSRRDPFKQSRASQERPCSIDQLKTSAEIEMQSGRKPVT